MPVNYPEPSKRQTKIKVRNQCRFESSIFGTCDKKPCSVFVMRLCLDSWVCTELCHMSSLSNFCHASRSTQLNILGPFVECCYCSDHWMIYLKLEETTHCKLSHRMSTNVPKHLVYINFILHTRSLLFKRKKKKSNPTSYESRRADVAC